MDRKGLRLLVMFGTINYFSWEGACDVASKISGSRETEPAAQCADVYRTPMVAFTFDRLSSVYL